MNYISAIVFFGAIIIPACLLAALIMWLTNFTDTIDTVSKNLEQENIAHTVITGNALDYVSDSLEPDIGPKPDLIDGIIVTKPGYPRWRSGESTVLFFSEDGEYITFEKWPGVLASKVVEKYNDYVNLADEINKMIDKEINE